MEFHFSGFLGVSPLLGLTFRFFGLSKPWDVW